jgi:methionyl aminopeptidase
MHAVTRPAAIPLKSLAEREAMRRAGRAAASVLTMLEPHVRAGVRTAELDAIARDYVLGPLGCESATIGYTAGGTRPPFPGAICTSVNHVVCHGIPGAKALRDGDIVNVDVTLILDGWHGDSSRMYQVGEVKRAAERLVQVTWEAMMRGISAIRPGGHTGDIGAAIQEYAEGERCSVVRDFCGHGLGELFHDAPNILHYGRRGEGVQLRPGMIFTVEPMINLGRAGVKVLGDGWTAVTRDRSLSAQYEHTVGVTETGCEIFTLSPAGYTVPPYI